MSDIQHHKPSHLTTLSQLLSRQSEALLALVNAEQDIRVKLSDVGQVPMDEINDLARNVNTGLYDELSMKQRQQLYLKQIQQSHQHIKSKMLAHFCNSV